MKLPTTPSFRLDGRHALVTGASSGIGLGAAAALAGAGARVTLAARGAQKLEEVADAFRAAGFEADTLVLDAGDLESALPAIEGAGPFDILVNNAGLARHSTMVEAKIADFDAVMDVNVRGAYFIAQTVARGMLGAKKPGVILNMSSQMGHVGGVERTVYCASKHAIEGLTRAMCLELSPQGIRVNTICPTFVRTPMTARIFEDSERMEWILSKIRTGRVAEVEDIMGAVVFLASDAAAMITGTSLLVDGGWTAD